MSTSSRLSPKRCPDAAASTCRAVSVNGRSSALVVWRSKDNPTSAASVTSSTATTLPAGPSFAGRVRLTAVKAPSRRGTNSWLLSNEAPHHPQKRFSGGLAWRHRGHGGCSAMAACPPFPYSTTLATLYQPPTRLILVSWTSVLGQRKLTWGLNNARLDVKLREIPPAPPPTICPRRGSRPRRSPLP